MNSELQLGACPSLDEFQGYYNIPDQYDGSFPILRTAKRVPRFGFSELFHVWKVAKQWFGTHAPRRDTGVVDPLHLETFIPRFEADDRSLCVDDADFGCLSIDFLKQVRQDFLKQFPLWRVILTGDDHSCAIVIYPNGVRFGNLPPDLEPEEALEQLVPHTLAVIAERERPQREHMAWLNRRLPRAVREIGDRAYHIVGVVDSHDGDRKRLSVEVLMRGNESHVITMRTPKGKSKRFWWTSSVYGVSAEGEIVSYITVPEGTPFCVKPWLPPATYRGLITIVERETVQQRIYEIRSESIARVTD